MCFIGMHSTALSDFSKCFVTSRQFQLPSYLMLIASTPILCSNRTVSEQVKYVSFHMCFSHVNELDPVCCNFNCILVVSYRNITLVSHIY